MALFWRKLAFLESNLIHLAVHFLVLYIINEQSKLTNRHKNKVRFFDIGATARDMLFECGYNIKARARRVTIVYRIYPQSLPNRLG